MEATETPAEARIAFDTPFYAEKHLKIINKEARLVPFGMNDGQLELDRRVEEQRGSGLPQRALALKARQVGISTYSQAKLIHRATLRENQSALVVAHDTATGDKLFRIGQTMYSHLPDEPKDENGQPVLKPPIRAHRRGRFLHFAPPGAEAWQTGELYPNSTYSVDTAQEYQAGRGGTYQLAHLSEFAFWENPLDKLTSLLQGIPDDPETLLIIESTANGYNLFRDLWEDAEQGRSGFIPFFWPWWREPDYSLEFANEREREDFERQLHQGPYGEDEAQLQEMGLTLEQLYWRRQTIANKCSGKLEKFRQEYPATPEEAFIASGQQVFDANQVRSLLVECEITDPTYPTEENPGPERCRLEAGGSRESIDRSGDQIMIPTQPVWVPDPRGEWRLWKRPEGGIRAVVGVDPSGGEMTPGSPTAAWNGVQVIDHKTREQLAEYKSHIDANELAKLVYLAALAYGDAWVAPEVTGGWGLPVARRLYHDYHYPFVYQRMGHSDSRDRMTKMLGWNTTTATKPILEANGQEMLREGSHGIKSRELAGEMQSYVKDERGRSKPQDGRFADLLMAWLIAQQVANELPVRLPQRPKPPRRPDDPITGY